MKERVLVAAFACAVLLLTVFSFQRGRTKDGYTAEDVAPPDFSAVVEKVMPSLVKVENEGLAGHPDITGKGSTVEIAQTREGTGFFIDKDGLILTNYHVIQGANALRVITSERRRYDAQIIGADVLSDVALIRIKPDFKVTPVALGDSARLKVGQWVLAMGNPLGLEFFSSAGIVSGFGPPGSKYVGFFDFIQADLNIEPGNSGGPMLNYKGEVVGINNAYLGPGTGIGFAIPINRAKEVVDALRKHGKISRGFLGMIGQPLSAGLAERLGVDEVRGALVSDVMEGSPADKGGLRPQDVVLEFNGQPVDDDRQMQEKVYTNSAGTKVRLLVLREGKRVTLPVVLGELEAHTLITQRIIRQCGLTLQPIPEGLARRLGLKDAAGLLVLKVVPGCPAFEGGLRFGDIIRKIEEQDVQGLADFYRVYNTAKPGKQILVLVLREGRPVYLTIKQEEG